MASNNYQNDIAKALELLKNAPNYIGVSYLDQNMSQLRSSITYYIWNGSEVVGDQTYDMVADKVEWLRDISNYYRVDNEMSGLSDPRDHLYDSGQPILEETISLLSRITSISWTAVSNPSLKADITFIGADLEWNAQSSREGEDVIGAGYARRADELKYNDNYLIFLDKKDLNNGSFEVDGSGRFWLQAHETLHALGFTDAQNTSYSNDMSDPSDSAEFDNMKYTIMSYYGHESFSRLTPEEPHTPARVFPTSLMLFDYLALQELGILGSYSPSYQDQLNAGMEIIGAGDGYDTDTADDNNVYRWDKDTRVLHTIFDTRGEDTISAAGHDHRAIIDLRQGHFSSYGQKNGSGFSTLPPVENLAIAYGTIIENAVGSNENDVLIGNVYDNNLKGIDLFPENYQTEQSLRDLLSQVSIEAGGNATILYSGGLPNGADMPFLYVF